ncbi:MAG TPA: NUDIX hydrolase [Cyanobacteria bacterium UBA11369]|nr:NUDIX hydrolase [Cyanobacteria bacterium UBA11371]HBE35274.1 NUDIX hydrolase [Cyanobacteria bacterium UBA11368]HBE48456.1 NUDIX hydrolase [Cyanobacteria bacterium UBA11369]
MDKSGKIRVLALGLILRSDRLFLSEGYDPIKQQTFYRALGGGVDFGETSQAALVREFTEEIQAELTNIRYLGCLENLFVYNGQPGHEIIQLYQCDFTDSQFYQPEKIFHFIDGEERQKAMWVELKRFTSGELKLVPEAFLDYALNLS